MVGAAALALLVAQGTPIVSSAPADLLRVSPAEVRFGTKRVGTITVKGAKVTNTSGRGVLLSIHDRSPDTFSFGFLPGQTCPVLEPSLLPPGGSCEAVMAFRPDDFFAGREQTAWLDLTVSDPDTGVVLATAQIPFRALGR
jgi:hypothetical protein